MNLTCSLGERYGLRIIPGRNSFLIMPNNVSRSTAVGFILQQRHSRMGYSTPGHNSSSSSSASSGGGVVRASGSIARSVTMLEGMGYGLASVVAGSGPGVSPFGIGGGFVSASSGRGFGREDAVYGFDGVGSPGIIGLGGAGGA